MIDPKPTLPRWQALGLPEDQPPINPYLIRSGDYRASDDAKTPEHPGDNGPDKIKAMA